MNFLEYIFTLAQLEFSRKYFERSDQKKMQTLGIWLFLRTTLGIWILVVICIIALIAIQNILHAFFIALRKKKKNKKAAATVAGAATGVAVAGAAAVAASAADESSEDKSNCGIEIDVGAAVELIVACFCSGE